MNDEEQVELDEDFLDEVTRERTTKNPELPQLVVAAERRRRRDGEDLPSAGPGR